MVASAASAAPRQRRGTRSAAERNSGETFCYCAIHCRPLTPAVAHGVCCDAVHAAIPRKSPGYRTAAVQISGAGTLQVITRIDQTRPSMRRHKPIALRGVYFLQSASWAVRGPREPGIAVVRRERLPLSCRCITFGRGRFPCSVQLQNGHGCGPASRALLISLLSSRRQPCAATHSGRWPTPGRRDSRQPLSPSRSARSTRSSHGHVLPAADFSGMSRTCGVA